MWSQNYFIRYLKTYGKFTVRNKIQDPYVSTDSVGAMVGNTLSMKFSFFYLCVLVFILFFINFYQTTLYFIRTTFSWI